MRLGGQQWKSSAEAGAYAKARVVSGQYVVSRTAVAVPASGDLQAPELLDEPVSSDYAARRKVPNVVRRQPQQIAVDGVIVLPERSAGPANRARRF